MAAGYQRPPIDVADFASADLLDVYFSVDHSALVGLQLIEHDLIEEFVVLGRRGPPCVVVGLHVDEMAERPQPIQHEHVISEVPGRPSVAVDERMHVVHRHGQRVCLSDDEPNELGTIARRESLSPVPPVAACAFDARKDRVHGHGRALAVQDYLCALATRVRRKRRLEPATVDLPDQVHVGKHGPGAGCDRLKPTEKIAAAPLDLLGRAERVVVELLRCLKCSVQDARLWTPR